MSTTPNPINPSTETDLLYPTSYKLLINKIPETAYYCTRVNIPGVALTNTEINTPFTPIPIAGDVLNFDTLNVNFIINENLSNYRSLFNWMQGLGFPNDFGQFRNLKSETPSEYSDATLLIYNNKNNLNLKLTFKRCFPYNLSGLDFDQNEIDINTMIAFASFKFTTYTFEVV